MDTNTTQAPDANDEIDLLDLLVTVAENIKLLILGPLLVGLVAWFWQPPSATSYQSRFSIEASRLIESATTSEIRLSPGQASQQVVKPLSRLVTSQSTLTLAAQLLKDQNLHALATALQPRAISINIERNSSLIQVSVRADTAEHAQIMAHNLWSAIQQTSQPQGMIATQLQQALAQYRADLENTSRVEALINQRILEDATVDAQTLNAYALMLSQNTQLTQGIIQTELKLSGLLDSDLLTHPILGVSVNTSRKERLTTIVAVLATGFALLLFVFMRQALRNAGSQPESAAKLARIRRALGFKA